MSEPSIERYGWICPLCKEHLEKCVCLASEMRREVCVLRDRVEALEQAILKNVDISWEPWKSLFPPPKKKAKATDKPKKDEFKCWSDMPGRHWSEVLE